MRDRLRAASCPSEMIDQIGGWTTTGISHGYGKGYSVEILAKWMERIKTSLDAFHPFSQYLHAIAFAIGVTDACGGPSAYLVYDV